MVIVKIGPNSWCWCVQRVLLRLNSVPASIYAFSVCVLRSTVRAICCASAIREAARWLGLEVHGSLYTGESELSVKTAPASQCTSVAGTQHKSPEVRPTAFTARPPHLPPQS